MSCRASDRRRASGCSTTHLEGTVTICLQYAGPHPLDRPLDPDSDEYIVAMSDMSAPAMIHFAAAPVRHQRHPPNPPPLSPTTTIRRKPSHLPPLQPWPVADAPGFSDAKALQAIQWIMRGYPKAEVGRALGVSRATISNFSTGRTWRHVPWPSGFGPCRPGCSQVGRTACPAPGAPHPGGVTRSHLRARVHRVTM